MGNRHPWSHLKNTCKIKSIDARGKKQPETDAAPSAPLPAKTSAKLLLPSTMSLHVPATSVLAHGPLTQLPRVYAPHTDIDAYNEMCRCPKDVTEAACFGTCRDLDVYQCPDTAVTKSSMGNGPASREALPLEWGGCETGCG